MGVKLDGRDPREFGLIFLKDHYHPHTPEMRSKTLIIPGRPGAWDFGSEWDIRTFDLPFAIIEYNKLEMQRKIRAFVAFLLDSYGRPREVKLTFDYEPEKYYSVKLAAQISPERFFFAEQFELPLVAHDPYAYAEISAFDSNKNHLYDTGLQYDADLIYDNPTWFLWINSRHYSGMYNHSSQRTPMKIKLKGVVTNPKISNQTTGEVIYLPTLTSFNDVLEVDSEKFTVKKNNINVLSQYSGAFLFLAPGENSLQFEGESPNATISYQWKHKFI